MLRVDHQFKGVARELAEAAGKGEVDRIAELITKRGADPNAVSTDAMPILLWPVHTGNLAGFKALLAHGAKINQRIPPNDVLMAFVIEARGLDFAQAAVQAGADLRVRNADDETLPMIARRHQRWDVVKFLITSGADVNAVQGKVGDTSLLSAALGFADFENALWLLQHGADPGFTLTADTAPNPNRIGAQPLLEEIFHRPISDAKLKSWQVLCQEWVRDKGFAVPPVPKRYAQPPAP